MIKLPVKCPQSRRCKLKSVYWEKRYWIFSTIVLIPFVATAVAVFPHSKPHAYCIFFALTIISFLAQRLRFKFMHCEKCGSLMRRNLKAEEEMVFYCKTCNIEWQTGYIQDLQ